MHVVIALAILAVSLSLGGCSHRDRAAYANPPPLPPPHPTNALRKAVAEKPRQAGKVSAKVVRAKMNKVRAMVVATPEEHRISKHTVEGALAKAEPKVGTEAKSKPPAAGGAIPTNFVIATPEEHISKRTVERALAKAEPKVGTEGKPKPPAAGGALPTTFDTVGGVANALTLGKKDQAVRTAKAYIDNLKVNVSLFYRDLAMDRLPSEQAEAAINLVPSVSLFDRPERGVANLKVLRQGIEKELAIDEADARNNNLAEARQKANERVLNARRLIRTIGTDANLDDALAYLDTLRTEPQWPGFVKMLTSAAEQEAEVKFKAAQAKAKKLGGPQTLTREDIDGLSDEQIKQLRGY
jgi:hypothetical protein